MRLDPDKRRMAFLTILICVELGAGAASAMARQAEEQAETPRQMAFWSLIYERPNPERLPVKAELWFL